MGNLSSGNRNVIRSYTDEALNFSVSFMKKQGWFNGTSGTGSMNWSKGGEKIASIGYSVLADRVMLDYRVNGKPVKETVWLNKTPCNYGGSRIWFQCPHCGKRSGVLYLAGELFVCRKCSGLHYASQSENEYDRAARAARKVRKRLDGDEYLELPIVRKPKWMHWKTFDRLRQKDEALTDKVNEELFRLMQSFVGPR